jgi:meso-butanediol dehydrogenase/(S,S)-butanediol dehydrogenase/diacetyl reductase
MSRFEKKTVLVTGGAGGIGLATAERFASEGARVGIADRDANHANAVVDQVRHAGAPDAWAFACDVSDPAQVASCVSDAIARSGSLDVVVNNAGVMTFKSIVDLTRDDWNRVLGVDLLGAFFFIQQAFQHMKPGGAVVNVASIHAVETEPMVAPYAAAKAALVSLTRSAALEGRPRGIRVNAVLPGAVDTPMLWDNPNVKAGIEKIDRTDVGAPTDIAAAIAYLASDDAKFVQGAALVVDGGRLDRL